MYWYIYNYIPHTHRPISPSPDPELRRREILQEIAAIDRMQRGRLCEQFFKSKEDGRQVRRGPYYVLQRWCRGRNHCHRVPAAEVAAVQSAIDGFARFTALVEEFAEITEQATLQAKAGAAQAKKNARSTQRRNSRKPKPS